MIGLILASAVVLAFAGSCTGNAEGNARTAFFRYGAKEGDRVLSEAATTRRPESIRTLFVFLQTYRAEDNKESSLIRRRMLSILNCPGVFDPELTRLNAISTLIYERTPDASQLARCLAHNRTRAWTACKASHRLPPCAYASAQSHTRMRDTLPIPRPAAYRPPQPRSPAQATSRGR